MSKEAFPLQTKRHVTISIPAALHAQAKQAAAQKGFDFSEMVSRLLRAELESKTGIARRFPIMEAAK